MKNTDMWVVEITNNVASIKDVWSVGDSKPKTDS
jgi:hypothetical protein